MQGLWLESQTLELRQNLPIPEPAPGEALVRVLRAGICNTDLELVRGYYPYNGILGHEFVGVVEQGPEKLINQRVVAIYWRFPPGRFANGRHREKLAHLEAEGIQTGFADRVQDRTFDIAVECTGNPEGFAFARRALRPRGTLVLKSTYKGNLTFDASGLVVDEITLIGSRCGPFPQALEVLSKNKINVQPLIQAHYPLTEAIAAFKHAQTRGVLKVLLDISE